jgi:hypothetical protein
MPAPPCHNRDNSNELCKSILQILRNLSPIAPPQLRTVGRPEAPMRGLHVIKFWANCYEAMRFACEAQAVISARLLLLALGDASASAEIYRMVSEKAIVFIDAQTAAEQALAAGLGLYEAAEQAYLPLRDRVHENSQRLLSAVN